MDDLKNNLLLAFRYIMNSITIIDAISVAYAPSEPTITVYLEEEPKPKRKRGRPKKL